MIVRLSRVKVAQKVITVVLIGITMLQGSQHGYKDWPTNSWIIACDFLLLVPFLAFTIVELVWNKIQIWPNSLTIRKINILLKPKLDRISFADIELYGAVETGSWCLVYQGKAASFYDFETEELHRVMLTKAPQAVAAKRWLATQVPPAEDFLSVWDLPRKTYIALTAANLLVLTLALIGILIHRFQAGALTGCSLAMGEYFVVIYNSFRKFDITSEQLALSGLKVDKSIRWEELKAVFHEKTSEGSGFTFVSETTSIRVPPHLAADPLLRSKLLDCMPKGTKCVNWNGFKFKRVKRRKRLLNRLTFRRPKPAALEPQL